METIYIVLIIVLGIITLVFLLRDRLKSFLGDVTAGLGSSTIHGGISIEAEADSSTKDQSTKTEVTGNIMEGKKQRIYVEQEGAKIKDNQMRGENLDIEVSDSDSTNNKPN